MMDIHSSIFGAHIGSRALLGKVFQHGFYLLKAASDATEFMQKCDNCQRCASDKKTFIINLIDPTNMATATVGNGYNWPNPAA